jgi:hypothetical protein
MAVKVLLDAVLAVTGAVPLLPVVMEQPVLRVMLVVLVVLVARLQGYLKLFRVELRVTGVMGPVLVMVVREELGVILGLHTSFVILSPAELAVMGVLVPVEEGAAGVVGRLQTPGAVAVRVIVQHVMSEMLVLRALTKVVPVVTQAAVMVAIALPAKIPETYQVLVVEEALAYIRDLLLGEEVLVGDEQMAQHLPIPEIPAGLHPALLPITRNL